MRRFDDRAIKIDQGRRYRSWEGVGQIAFVVRRLVDQREVILSSLTGPLCSRPTRNRLAAVGQTDPPRTALTQTPDTDFSASATSIIKGDISARVGANTPTRLPDRAASTANVFNIVLFPNSPRRPMQRDNSHESV